MQLYTWGEQIKINGEMHAKIELGNFSSFYSCKEIHSAHIVANTAYVCEHVRGREKINLILRDSVLLNSNNISFYYSTFKTLNIWP